MILLFVFLLCYPVSYLLFLWYMVYLIIFGQNLKTFATTPIRSIVFEIMHESCIQNFNIEQMKQEKMTFLRCLLQKLKYLFVKTPFFLNEI